MYHDVVCMGAAVFSQSLHASCLFWLKFSTRHTYNHHFGCVNAMGTTYDYDLVTIGAGSGGTRASRLSAAVYKQRVAVIELPFNYVASDETGGAGGTYVVDAVMMIVQGVDQPPDVNTSVRTDV